MADTSLANYFTIAPSSTTWGLGQNALVQALPILMQGRGTTNQQFGTALGMSLVSALLGYQARRSAADQSLQAAEIGSQMLGLATPQERLNLIKGVDSSNIQQSLLGLNARIGEQELTNQLIQRQKVGELTTNAEFALGDLGTKLFEREIAKEVAKQEVLTAALQQRTANRMAALPSMGALPPQSEKPQKDFWEKIPAAQKQAFTGTAGQVEQLRQLAATFRGIGADAVVLNLQRQIPGSKADLALSAMETLVPSTVKMLGDTGALSAYDQEQVKRATLGGRTSGAQSIAARLEQLANLAETKTTTALEQYKLASEQGGAGVLQQLKSGAGVVQPVQPAVADKAISDIAKLEMVIANPKVSETTKAKARAKLQELTGK
jgi:hypothetical protein